MRRLFFATYFISFGSLISLAGGQDATQPAVQLYPRQPSITPRRPLNAPQPSILDEVQARAAGGLPPRQTLPPPAPAAPSLEPTAPLAPPQWAPPQAPATPRVTAEGAASSPSSLTPPAVQPPLTSPAVPTPTPLAPKPNTAPNPIPSGASASDSQVTAESLDALTKQINDSTELKDEQKKEALDRIKSARQWLDAVAAADTVMAECQKDIAEANLAAEKAALAAPVIEKFPKPSPELSVTQAESALSDAELRLADARERLGKLEEMIRRRGARKLTLVKSVSEAQQRVEDANKALEQPANPGSLVDVARRADFACQRFAGLKQKQQYPMEQQRIETLADILPLRRDRVKREAAVIEKEVAHWKHWVAEFRKRDLQLEQARAREQLQQAAPALKGFAQKNSELASKRQQMLDAISSIESEIQNLTAQLTTLNETYEKTSEKVKKAGRSTTIGFMLRRERDHLPALSDFKQRIHFTRQTTPEIHLQVLELQDAQEQVDDAEAVSQSLAKQLPAAADVAKYEHMIDDLVATRRDLLAKLVYDHDLYVKHLGELELTLQSACELTSEFTEFIDERVLWIRSSEPLGAADIGAATGALRQIVSLDPWQTTVRDFVHSVRAKPRGFLTLIAALTFGWWVVRKLRKRLHSFGRGDVARLQTQEAVHVPMRATCAELAGCLLSAVAIPAVVWVAGWQLQTGRMNSWGNALGIALQATAITMTILKFASRACRGQGLGEAHFQWPPEMMRHIRRRLAWLSTFGIPSVFILYFSHELDRGNAASALARLALIVTCILIVMFTRSTLRGEVLERLTGESESVAWKWRCSVAHAAGVLLPILLSLFAIMGYDYSAFRLAMCCQATVALLLAVIVVGAMLRRWMLLREQLQATALAASADETVIINDSTGAQQSANAEQAAAFELTNSQLRYLGRYGAVAVLLFGGYVIWSEVLPALGVLDQVRLWSRWVDVKQTVAQAEGAAKIVTTSEEVVTTLKHAVFSILMLIAGGVLARCLPALLNVMILDRMPIDTGQRYAAGMVLRYLVSVGAMLMACRGLGLTWGSIQWLAAAMTVGLGFGLQEIFANLVSGLIILFERPVRVGDLVTVGGVSGRVTRMQIRATTVTDFDRRELIVPNKKFITEDVMNWTLTDDVNRIVIEVGVAYGSDVSLAKELLLAVANAHPLVMEDPPPMATFDRFADSSLNMTLRCFLPSLENRLNVIHELHESINREFANAKIEIAFPQQDLHVRSIDVPLTQVLAPPTKKEAA